MGEKRTISIRLDKVHDIAYRGVRRAYVFLGLGLNAARRPDFNEFHLQGRGGLRFLPDEVGDDEVARFKENFANWIISNGLRELIEFFSKFLLEIYFVCLIVDVTQSKLSPRKLPKMKKIFDRRGPTEKLESLAREYKITCEFVDHIDSLRRLRNCYTHRLGTVGSDDCNDGKYLTIKWRGLDVFVQENDGNRIPIPWDADEAIYVERGGSIMTKMTDRTKTLPIGTFASIEQTELKEICWTMILASNEIRDSAVNFLSERGIPTKTQDSSME